MSRRNESIDTLVCGLEHFIDKIGYQAAEYARQGIRARYLVLDKSGVSSRKAADYGADVMILPVAPVSRLWWMFREVCIRRPQFVELYDIGRLTLCYALLAKLSGGKLIMILRGAELWGDERGRRAGWSRRIGLRLALGLCDAIVAKEENILRDLDGVGVAREKVSFLGNAVPMPKAVPKCFKKRTIDVLFLNSVKGWRNLSVLLHGLSDLRDRGVSFRAVIAGFTTFDETDYKIDPVAEEEALDKVEELGLGDLVKLKGFVADAHNYHASAKIFVLPADIIYANYSLLESMGHGVVPIVGDGEGAERIVEHERTGFILNKDPAQWSLAIERLLKDSELWASLSVQARRKIEREFSIAAWVKEMKRIRGRLSGK